MTENEAIELLRSMQNPKQDYADVVCAPAFCNGFRFVYPEPEDYAIEEAIKALKEIQQYREIGSVKECKEMASIVKKSERSELANIIDEWIEYRKIGTVEECKEMAVIANKKTNPDELAKIIVEWIQYNKIGTVEECREAVEKQKPKKPHRNYKKFSGLWCKCGWYLGQKQCLDIKYCPNCGQAIDENLEGMEGGTGQV